MKELILQIKRLKKDKISSTVNQRMKEFETVGNKNSNEIFKELCFCLLTANFSAAGGLRIQKEIGDDFLTLSKEDLSKENKEIVGYKYKDTGETLFVKDENGQKQTTVVELHIGRKEELNEKEWQKVRRIVHLIDDFQRAGLRIDEPGHRDQLAGRKRPIQTRCFHGGCSGPPDRS